MSIRENIAYGDNSRSDIPLEEIIDVAKQANIHDFILTLPQVCSLSSKEILHSEDWNFRVMKQNVVQKELNYQVDKSKELLLLEHWFEILKFCYSMKVKVEWIGR